MFQLSNSPLNHYCLSSPDHPVTELVNNDLQQEEQYDHHNLQTINEKREPLPTEEQKWFMIGLCWLKYMFFFLGHTRWNR